jgi:hypothetical protein
MTAAPPPGPRAAAARPLFNADESPIAWLHRRKDRNGEPMISDSQFQAGERIRADFWFAQMTPRTTTNWSPVSPARRGRRYGASPSSSVDASDRALAAGERVRRALSAVGPELSDVLIDVCCHLRGLEDLERAAGWPQRSAKIVLQLALTRLARHYGLERETPGREAGIVRHWGSEDYRPLFDVPGEGD